jgi:formate hydrogenlyase subunit 6/NADH:ubiquinone oxidoreductase subunit I
MFNRIVTEILCSLLKKPVTNNFPLKEMPDSLTDALSAENTHIVPPTPVSPRFRGRLLYDRSRCIGCRLCMRVCPANATHYEAETKKIVIHNDRCCFCAQCTEVCPVKCLKMSSQFLTSSYDRKAELISDTGTFASETEG